MSKKLWDPFAQFQKNVLPNGLAVYSLFQNRPFLKIFFVIHSGSLTDLDSKPGRAHFVEHLLCTNVPDLTSDDIRKFFKGNVSLGMTYDDFIRYSCTIPADRKILQRALDIFGTMLLPGKINKHFTREKSVIRQEFFREHRNTFNYENYFLKKMSALYGNFPGKLFEGGLGNPDTIDSIDQADVQSFCDEHLVPQNMSIVVVGGLKLKEDIIDSFFHQYRSGERNQKVKKLSIAHLPTQTRHSIRLSDIFKDTKMLDKTALYESAVLLPGTIDPKIVSLGVKMLKHQLYQKIRRKYGDNYHFSASFKRFKGIYELQLYGQVHLDIIHQIEGFVQQCIEEIQLNAALFERMKDEALTELRLFDPNIGIIAMNASTDIVDYDRVISLQEEINVLEDVSFNNIQELMGHIFPIEKRWTFLRTP